MLKAARLFWLLIALTLASEGGFALAASGSSASQPAPALKGTVSSKAEGLMEGVLVNARRQAGTVTVTVVSDARGNYSFPADRLAAGTYDLSVRAVGYELRSPRQVSISAHETSRANLKLDKVADVSVQLSNAEWMLSVPGRPDQKAILLECTSCHTLERIVRSHYSAQQFMFVLPRMFNYTNMTSALNPQPYPAGMHRPQRHSPAQVQAMAAYLASINLSSVPVWQYPLKTLPRPRGEATRAIITQYDLPRSDAQPHDVQIDSHGQVWYADFGYEIIGELDPKTAQVTEVPLPASGIDTPLRGSLDLELAGNSLWVGMMFKDAVAKYDLTTRKFQMFPDPGHRQLCQSMVNPHGMTVDGKVWSNNADGNDIPRLDLASGKWEALYPFKDLPPSSPLFGKPHGAYGLAVDKDNNLYFMDFSNADIGRIDAKTGKASFFMTPTPHSQPRRGNMDSQGNLWFAEYHANSIGMLDTKTGHIQEWEAPTPWFAPYDVIKDRTGELWSGGMSDDMVWRLDPKTGKSVMYLLPQETNIRRVAVDNSTTPVTFWVGSNHGASIIRLEPRPSAVGQER